MIEIFPTFTLYLEIYCRKKFQKLNLLTIYFMDKLLYQIKNIYSIKRI